MQRRWWLSYLAFVLIASFLLGPLSAQASQPAQDDPVAQCAAGVELFLDGRATEALPLLEAGFAKHDATVFADREDLGRCALALAILRSKMGDLAGALDASAVALDVFRVSGNLEFVGATLNNIGSVYDSQGRYAEALEVFEQALAIAREVGDRAGEGKALNNIGLVHDAQGHYTEALEAYQKALIAAREIGDRTGEGATLNNIGDIYLAQGRYGEALVTFEQTLAIEREVGNRAGEGTALANIGGVYAAQGRYAEALATYQQALGVVREAGNRAHEGAALNNIGLVYYAQGRYAKAREAYQQALAIAGEIGDRAGEGTGLNNIGLVYHAQGRYAEALEAYQQALAIAREIGDRAGEGTGLNNIGGVYHAQKRYAEALEAYQQALAIAGEIGDRAGESTALNNIGGLYYGQRRSAEALDAYQQALTIVREVGGRVGEGKALANIGEVYQQQGEATKGLEAYEQAMAVFESLRVVAGSEADRASFIAQYTNLYSRTVELYHDQGQDDAAFLTSERGRARAFLDSLATGYVELSDNTAADLLTREQEAYAARQAAQDALARARALNAPDATLLADLEAQLAAAEAEHAAALDAITARRDQLATLVPGRNGVLDLPSVQALLDDQTTLVSYYVLGDTGTLAFVITRSGMDVVELPEATPGNLNRALTDLYEWIKSNRQNPYPLPLRDLHSWLVAPLAPFLHTARVGIIPHQLLHYVPFAALTDGDTYFGQRYTLFNLPSASALPYIQANAAAAPVAGSQVHSLVFGDPKTGIPDLLPLKYAEAEAKAVAKLLDAPASTGADASEARLGQEAAGAKVMHLAAHGGYNAANPLYSTVYLAPGGEDDGRLEAHEVYGLNLKGNDLVVLSACETNLGRLSAGDELVGMTRAFMFAGASTVVASLWSVDDKATSTLMTAFYRHLQEGMGKAAALQTAQAEVRANPQWAGPFYWAAFVLSGDPSEPDALPANRLISQSARTATSAASAIAVWLLAGLVGVTIALVVAALVFRRSRDR